MAAVRGAGIIEGNEMLPKKQRTELRTYKKIPVWLCEYHQEVLRYIYRGIGSKFLPFSGITLLHFDSHPDLMAPLDMKAESVFDKEVLFDVVSIADWILPAVYAGHIKKVIWIKAPWSQQISDKILCFNVGRHKVEGTIRVSCCEKYFCEDGLYAPDVELENCKELTVVVKTIPIHVCNTLPDCDMDACPPGGKQLITACTCPYTDYCNKMKDNQSLEYIQEKHLCTCSNSNCIKGLCLQSECHKETKSRNDKIGKTSSLKCHPQEDLSASNQYCKTLVMEHGHNCNDKKFEGDMQLFINEVLSLLEEPYILDIDMDFFSTLNPFEAMFSKEEFETLKKFYEFPQVDSSLECNMKDASERHKANVQRLEKTLNFLKESDCDDFDAKKELLSVDVAFVEFIKRWKDARSAPVDYEIVHSAGMTTNLPVHITDEHDIIQMIRSLERLFSSLPKPTIITVARSSDDDYTPPSSVEFIQSCLSTCLQNCYKENVEFFHKYKDK